MFRSIGLIRAGLKAEGKVAIPKAENLAAKNAHIVAQKLATATSDVVFGEDSSAEKKKQDLDTFAKAKEEFLQHNFNSNKVASINAEALMLELNDLELLPGFGLAEFAIFSQLPKEQKKQEMIEMGFWEDRLDEFLEKEVLTPADLDQHLEASTEEEMDDLYEAFEDHKNAHHLDKHGAKIIGEDRTAFSLEWVLSSPPPLHQFEEPPTFVEWPKDA